MKNWGLPFRIGIRWTPSKSGRSSLLIWQPKIEEKRNGTKRFLLGCAKLRDKVFLRCNIGEILSAADLRKCADRRIGTFSTAVELKKVRQTGFCNTIITGNAEGSASNPVLQHYLHRFSLNYKKKSIPPPKSGMPIPPKTSPRNSDIQ